ncbi:phage holin family protein [Prevotella lacticifex]|uniref:Uncharacterized protein n=1 Tax=Prevotella lacticifex TaxID=2854755 RepID=A0A9R1CWS2_9BACT|nr:phage holin family protein [Prevotella lacticifex]GJG35775.1 hypothetical protein PRLR5003_09320 [Prevotella lacticifex]GJG39176.1 hypothetical protein PRLR5019_11470 [Prevotella lacticifex]GJG42144.1 hypothetical protein PRLR5025_09300 [Prevotella lacticifex]GJG45530.1 hypothetical protein PRLR5027_11250 [Prevotella lacticifex]GJG48495.1 hypothetical protein PRLR5052_09080 [Prevotella lacticifex]
MNVLIQFITKFLHSYDYASIKDFCLSLCPSFKYNLQMPSILISSILAFTSKYLGLGPVIVLAMFVAVITETVTGIQASKKLGKKFESFRFSRCVIKVAIWMILVYIANSFTLECESRDGWINSIGATFFDIVRLFILIYFVIEYFISILENLAVIDGRPKTDFTDALHDLWKAILELFKGKISNQ